MVRIGLISDTHGLLRPEALAFLAGCDHIVHAGDIGTQAILDELGPLALLTVVRGNNDKGPWADVLPESASLRVEDVAIHVLHDLAELDIYPAAAGVRIVVCGHSHKPLVQERDGVLYVNPGSAGPRRFKLPISIGELIVTGGEVSARLVELDIPKAR
ncbi:metallophosphoesterase family protein [Azoarcus sp. KH32C]|uniref:metallophosphoesterase family protein n=1 Tax=Azoarcus sp. KH32C TaxID=748247 RepID=UPI0002386F35|nr:metallophosphoesterase family protein [Azoarcus sp. KH32C]BAL26092.1 phosphodiesterase, MJ0936 family [Azoarcus sp. KH32C]